MEYIVEYGYEMIFTIIGLFLTYVFKKIKDVLKIIETNKKAIKVMIESMFLDKYYHSKAKKCISVMDKNILNDLYIEYKSLGGKGLVDDIYNDLDVIPLERNCE